MFYATESLAEIVLQTAVATLATAFAFASIVILAFCLLVFALPGRPDLDILAILWPKWESRERYKAIAMCAVGVVLVEAAVVVARLQLGSAIAIGAGVACCCRRMRCGDRADGQTEEIEGRTTRSMSGPIRNTMSVACSARCVRSPRSRRSGWPPITTISPSPHRFATSCNKRPTTSNFAMARLRAISADSCQMSMSKYASCMREPYATN